MRLYRLMEVIDWDISLSSKKVGESCLVRLLASSCCANRVTRTTNDKGISPLASGDPVSHWRPSFTAATSRTETVEPLEVHALANPVPSAS